MSGLGRVIVGYREGDPRIGELWREHGHRALPHRKCIADCGATVWFVESGQDAIRDREPEVICDVCYPRYRQNILAEL